MTHGGTGGMVYILSTIPTLYRPSITSPYKKSNVLDNPLKNLPLHLLEKKLFTVETRDDLNFYEKPNKT